MLTDIFLKQARQFLVEIDKEVLRLKEKNETWDANRLRDIREDLISAFELDE